MRKPAVLACMVAALMFAACTGGNSNLGGPLPTGDATRGAALFTQSVKGAPSCNTCHTLDGSVLIGPSLKDFSTRAGTRVEGISAADYARNSILQPSSYVVSGFANLMYGQFAQHLSPQDTADLIAYILSL